MGLRNAPDRWGSAARFFHWAIVVLVLIQIPLGFWMVEVYEHYTETYGDDRLPLVLQTSMAHHTIGFTVMILAALRLSWRLQNVTPELPALAMYQRWLARVTHVVLYLMMFLYPFTGWAALSAYEGEFPIFFFGWDSVPRIVPQVPEGSRFDYETFAEMHRFYWKLGAGVLGLHIIGALWHHFVKKDGVLKRMLPG